MDADLAWFVRKVMPGNPRSAADGAYFECRRCGTALDDEEEVCPRCGFSDVARFELH